MKNYTLIVEDKQGNELTKIDITAENKKEAQKQRDIFFANCKINDCTRVVIK